MTARLAPPAPGVVTAEADREAGERGRWFVASSLGDGTYYAIVLSADGTATCSCHHGQLVAMRQLLGTEARPGTNPCRHLTAVESSLRALAAKGRVAS